MARREHFFKNIEIRNVSGRGAKIGLLIKGFPEKRLKNLTLENIDLVAENAWMCSDVEDLHINNVTIRSYKDNIVK